MSAPAAVIKGVQAAQSLRNAENAAARRGGDSFIYTGNGRDEDDDTHHSVAKTKKKGLGAVAVILLTLFGICSFLSGSHSLLGPAMQALIPESTDLSYASTTRRTNRIIRYALKNDGGMVTSWFGAKKYARISPTFKNRLAKNGITVEGSGSGKTLKYKGTEISADDFKTKFDTDVEFRDAFTSARRGRLTNFFDSVALKFNKKIGVFKNLFNKFKQTGDSDVDADNFQSTVSKKFTGGDTKVNATDVDTDESGNKVPGQQDSASGSRTETDIDSAKPKAQSMLDTIAGKAAKGTAIANAGCKILQVANMISAIVAANQIYSAMMYGNISMEPGSKTMAGKGNEAPLNTLLNKLTTPVTTTLTKMQKGQAKGEDVTVTASPADSNPFQMAMAWAPATSESNDFFSIERLTNSFIGAPIITSVGTFGACSTIQISGAILSLIVTVAGGLPGIVANLAVKVVVGSIVAIAISEALKFAVPAIAQWLFTDPSVTAQGKMIGAMIMLGTGYSAFGSFLGGGASLQSSSAASAYTKMYEEVLALEAEVDRKNHSPFDMTNKNTFLGSIAYNTLLPLAMSSNKASSRITTFSTLTRNTNKAIASLATNVLADGDETTTPATNTPTFMKEVGDCPNLESIGAVGNALCIPISGTDTSTTDLDPDDPTYIYVLTEKTDTLGRKNLKCDEEGNCTVVENSRLDLYINHCSGRNSPFGVVDQNVLGALNTSFGTVGDSVLNSIPIIGDLLDILEGEENAKHLNWATGQICVNSDKNPDWDNEIKYYQRYVEDMRILDQLGNLSSDSTTGASGNPVIAAQERYEANHPFEDSYEGYLSRISGLTQENVEYTLAVIEYYLYVQDYNPDTRLAHKYHDLTKVTSTKAVASIKASHPNFIKIPSVETIHGNTIEPAKQYIIYNDLRIRTLVA